MKSRGTNQTILIIFCLILVFVFGYVYYASKSRPEDVKIGDPLLAVVIMVKDEEAVIVETIEPFVKGGVDAFLIFDTGSTDKTIERITAYFKEKGIARFFIEQEPFVDFATSRNRGLELAEKHFPHAGFFIMPDAEWYIHGADHLLAFCKKQLPSEQYGLYSVDTFYKDNCSHYGVPRLFRAKSHIRFAGIVHEIPDYKGITLKVSEKVWIDHRSSEYGDEKTLKRIHRDIKWLLAEHEKDPTNTRTIFYLAQSYTVLGAVGKCVNYCHEAIRYLKKRVQAQEYEEELFVSLSHAGKVTGHSWGRHQASREETFVALLRMGQLYEQLFFRGEAKWQDAEDAFLLAAQYRPSRSEPLIHLANHYMCYQNPELAYEYALKACNAPYPYEDNLSINKELYDFDRWNILARTAAWLGKWHEAELGAYTALKVHADIPQLQTILAWGKTLNAQH